MKSWGPPVPRLDEVRLNSNAALFVAVVSVAVTALVAAAPLSAIAAMLGGNALRPASRGAIGVLIAVVLLGAWLPARRAARIDPTLALKRE